MSMDDVYTRVQALEAGLGKFNDALRAGFEEVTHSHAQVAPLWDDAMRREYDRTWKPLEEDMQEYVQRVGPNYVDFLIERLHHLRAYLHGHGA